MGSFESKAYTEAPIIVLSTFAVAKTLLFYSMSAKRPKDAICIGRVASLNVYPVKSLPPLRMQQVSCSEQGAYDVTSGTEIFDRQFCVTNEDGNFLSQRRLPQMALLSVQVQDKKLCIIKPDKKTLNFTIDPPPKGNKKKCRVWGEELEGIDCGDEVAVWLSEYLGLLVRLVMSTQATRKRTMLTAGTTKWHKATKEGDKVAFADFAPYLLTTEASLKGLNEKLTTPVDMRHFRPNITVSGSFAPYDEDTWNLIFIGDARFKNFKPCDRCILTTVDPDTGIKDSGQEPLSTLRSYRVDPTHSDSPLFGVNLLLEKGGDIHVGDPVYVTRK